MQRTKLVPFVIIVCKDCQAIKDPNYCRRKPPRRFPETSQPNRPARQRPIQQNDQSYFDRSRSMQNHEHRQLERDEELCFAGRREGLWADIRECVR